MPNARLIEILRGSVRFGNFPLSSGKNSSFYIDCKEAVMLPECLSLVCEEIEKILGRDPVDSLGGVVIGPDPIIGAIVQRSWGKVPVRGFLIRKEAKSHGTAKLIEGALRPGDRVALLEDVITSGGSILQAAARVREFGATVSYAVAVVDRLGGAEAELAKERIPLFSLLTLRDLIGEKHESEA